MGQLQEGAISLANKVMVFLQYVLSLLMGNPMLTMLAVVMYVIGRLNINLGKVGLKVGK